MLSLWEQRAARNEALFREVNEHIASLEERFGGSAPDAVFICECASDLCTDRMPVDSETYRRVREHPRRFLVLPGHVDESLETVVERHPGFLVVEKMGLAGEIADAQA